MGAGQPRPLAVPGAELAGVCFAMDFLSQQNRRVAGDAAPPTAANPSSAKGKHVIVIGGGDTGSDCVGTSIRQGARSVTQLEILPKPPEASNPETPWPDWPRIMRTSSSQEEGCQRPLEHAHQGDLAAAAAASSRSAAATSSGSAAQGLGNAGNPRQRVHAARRVGPDRHGLCPRGPRRPGRGVGPGVGQSRQRGWSMAG